MSIAGETEFVPDNTPADVWQNLKSFAIINVIFDVILYLRLHNQMPTWYGMCGAMAVVFLCVFMTIKSPKRIVIFKTTGQLQFDYTTFLGKDGSMTIDIPSATYSYRWQTSRAGGGMQFTIYNSYWNPIKLRPSTKNGFTADQLVAIDQAITEIKDA